MEARNSKTATAIYWGTTGLFSLMMLGAAFAYLTSPDIAKAFVHLGFPSYFRVELAIAKIIGVIVLLAPVSRWLKEWAYAGFTITLVSAVIAHSSIDGVQTAIPPIVGFVILGASYFFFRKKVEVTGGVAGRDQMVTVA